MCLALQDIQQRCCGLIWKEKEYFFLKTKVDCQIYWNEGTDFKSTFEATPDYYYIRKSNVDVSWCGFMAPRDKLLQ